MEGTLSQIFLFAGNFAPNGWAFCQGQILAIAQNTAVFSLVGTTYGGNGQTTFGLPDFRSRVPVGMGQGPGLPDVSIGEQSGAEAVTLLLNQMPSHTHTATPAVAISTLNASSDTPNGNVFATEGSDLFAAPAAVNSALSGTSLTTSSQGNGQPLSIMQPALGINFIFCMQGVYPARN